jgi:FixJ family two-component response regulator
MSAAITVTPSLEYCMTGATPVVFIVDDDISVRESLEGLVADAGFRPEPCASAQDFLNHSRPDGPSCLILDLRLPDINGLEVQRRIAAERAEMPIIFITGHGDIPTTVRAMKAGATEFLSKPFAAEDLLEAIRKALERSRARLSEQASLQILQTRHRTLSPRERDVMELVVLGRLNKQVGAELGISEITVKAHRGRMMRKMRAKSVPELVNMAGQLGLDTGVKR